MGFSHSVAPLLNSNRPGHRLEEPPLHGLQCEDRQVGRNDDAAGKEDRAQNFMRGLANFLRRGVRRIFPRKVAHHVFNHHHGAIHQHAKVKCAE